jgi:hypothetical protein
VPRRKIQDAVETKPYLNSDGTLNFDKIFRFQEKQTELLRNVMRNGKLYVQPAAEQCLSTGGIRSGKTCGWLFFMVMHYCLQWENCNLLVLRRTFKELESGAIADFKTFMPKELYEYDQTKHVATLKNGSKVVFGHCVAKGALITTQRGLVPIEEVTLEDSVLTRKGFRRVLWSGQTGTKEVVQLGPLSLTKDHKVLIDGEWKSIEDLACRKGLKKTVNLLCHRDSYLKVLSTTDTQTQNEGLTVCTTKGGEIEQKPISTSLFMKACTGLFQKVLKFITRMKTHLTTRSMEVITNYFLLENTELSMHHTVSDVQDDHYSENLGLYSAGNAASQLSQEQKRNTFVMLTVETPSVQTVSKSVPVFDLQIEEEHEFFANGILVHNCQNNKDRDIEQYLGQAYPAILVDECGQFSPDAWLMLYSRNIVNAGCVRDEAGNLPVPAIVGCTNPLGPHYEYYRTLFVQKEPWNPGDGAKRDPVDGTWWIQESGEWVKIYDPSKYAYQRSTVMDNPELLARDPGIIQRLMSMPKAKRDKVLYGYDGAVEGQYFDCFDPSYHVINLREDPEAIIWQDWQPVWCGQDWGMSHANATYFFTKAMVKDSVGDNYRLKTVCFQEVVTTGGKTMDELASILKAKAHLPNGKPVVPKAIYFSHEKFNRQMDSRTPADEYSRALKLVGLPSVTSATRDRIGSASLMYNAIKKGELVILDICKEIILAIPSLMRNPDLMDDVLKVDAKGDDAYDGFRYGLYGHLSGKKKPEEQVAKERVLELRKSDPLAAWFLKLKLDAEKSEHTASFVQNKQPVWMSKS